MRVPIIICTFVLMLSALISCVPANEIKKETSEAVIPDAELPRTVVILPFRNDTKEIGIANQVRRAFANHFSAKNYRDIKLPLVDEKIVHLEKSSGKSILDLSPQEICESLECDGLIYGEVTDYKKVYAGVYSQLGVEAEVWMVNTRTGKEIFRMKDSVRYHQGGVPMSVLGAIMTAVSTAMNLREIQQVRMVDELAYKFTEKIPSPSGAIAEDRPLIREVLSNAKEGPFGKGKVIRVGLEGEKGLVGTFSIGNFKKGVPMKETKPGIYMGEYLVLPGDNTADMPLIASLKRPGGYETEWVDVSGLVTIHTTPPPQVIGLRARGFQDRIEISWDPLKNIQELKGYKVLRSEQPLSGYTELTMTEHAAFEDKTAKGGADYYYRVIAFDYTGNESAPQDAVMASIVSKEPVVLTGEISKDMVLSGTYLIKGEFIVPRGLTITVQPETRVLLDENAALIVRGKLNSKGGGAPAEFVPSADKRWKGIVVDNGQIMLSDFRIKGAETALTAYNAEGLVENGVITNSETGISISGTPSLMVKACTISGSGRGLALNKTDARIIKNNIFQNKDGIIIKDFSGEIADNNIFDNERNISSDPLIKISVNYLGSINTDEMKIAGVTLAKVYDGRVPEGKPVDAVSNPYTSLNQEERQKKGAEFVIEAGNYFRQRNYGRASTIFEESLKVLPTPEVYYYLALSYQEMKENDKALRFLREGAEKFPKDSTLLKALGLVYYEKGDNAEAKKVFEEVIRLSPEDKQVRFMLERMGQ